MYFLTTVTIQDGEHEHTSHVITQAKNEEQARKQFQAAMHDTDCWGRAHNAHCDHPFSFGDGCSASSFSLVRRISTKDAKALDRLISIYEIAATIEPADETNHPDEDDSEEEGCAG